MAAERLSMRKVREVLRLKHALGMSYRRISAATGAGKTQAADYVRRTVLAGITWPVPEELDDAELERPLFPVADAGASVRTAIDWPAIQRELKRRSVTLALLWPEYLAEHPNARATRGFASFTRTGASACRRRCGRRMWPARSCLSIGPATPSPSAIRPPAGNGARMSSWPRSEHLMRRSGLCAGPCTGCVEGDDVGRDLNNN